MDTGCSMSKVFTHIRDEELFTALKWAEEEGWNPGRYDLKAYYALDNSGFLMLTLDDMPIGVILALQYSTNFAFLGILIVKPEYRSLGYGAKLWCEALKKLKNCPSIGLYAVPQQVGRYESDGFIIQHKNDRFEFIKKEQAHVASHGPTTIKSINFDKLNSCDMDYWGFPRGKFYEELLRYNDVHAYAIYDENEKKLYGYGLIRPCLDGYRIGPLYCEDFQSAITLTQVLLSKVPNGSKIFFDVPHINKYAAMFAEFFHCKRVPKKDTYTMFKGIIYNNNAEKCYGIASLEIG